MNRITKTIITVVGTILFCTLIALIFPILKEPLLMIGSMAWTLFKSFFLEDTIKSVVFYIVIAIIITALGFTISAKTERKIWAAVSVLADIITLIVFLVHSN